MFPCWLSTVQRLSPGAALLQTRAAVMQINKPNKTTTRVVSLYLPPHSSADSPNTTEGHVSAECTLRPLTTRFNWLDKCNTLISSVFCLRQQMLVPPLVLGRREKGGRLLSWPQTAAPPVDPTARRMTKTPVPLLLPPMHPRSPATRQLTSKGLNLCESLAVRSWVFSSPVDQSTLQPYTKGWSVCV